MLIIGMNEIVLKFNCFRGRQTRGKADQRRDEPIYYIYINKKHMNTAIRDNDYQTGLKVNDAYLICKDKNKSWK